MTSVLLMEFVTRATRLKILVSLLRSAYSAAERGNTQRALKIILIRDPQTSVRARNILTMAIARPIRALAFVSLLLCAFLLYQVFSPSTPSKTPGTGVIIDKDPNLDCTCPLNHIDINSH